MSTKTPSLDLGKLLRMRAMVTQAAQVEATYHAGGALVRAYHGLRAEMFLILEPEALADLRAEFQRLFPSLGEPPMFSPALAVATQARLAEAASEAQLSMRKLQGWIQGLIDELTLDQRLRLEAEAKAKEAAMPRTGFGAE